VFTTDRFQGPDVRQFRPAPPNYAARVFPEAEWLSDRRSRTQCDFHNLPTRIGVASRRRSKFLDHQNIADAPSVLSPGRISTADPPASSFTGTGRQNSRHVTSALGQRQRPSPPANQVGLAPTANPAQNWEAGADLRVPSTWPCAPICEHLRCPPAGSRRSSQCHFADRQPRRHRPGLRHRDNLPRVRRHGLGGRSAAERSRLSRM